MTPGIDLRDATGVGELPGLLAQAHEALLPGTQVTVLLPDGLLGGLPGGPPDGLPDGLLALGDVEALFESAGFQVSDRGGVGGAGSAGGAGRVGGVGGVRRVRGVGKGRGVGGGRWVRATRLRTLPDIVGPGMRLLVCGLNPSVYSADRGIGFARPGNRFWPAALAAGIVTRDRDGWHALRHHGVGFTDLVKRATPGAADLTSEEYRHGAARLAWTVRLLDPAVLCFVGLTGYRAAVDRTAVAGPQAEVFAGVPVYVMPNTSGINAHTSPAASAAHLAAAMALGSGAGTGTGVAG